MNIEKKINAYEDSPKTKNGRFFSEIDRNHPPVILSSHVCNLGEKWRRGVVYKSKNAKIEIGLNTPLRLYDQIYVDIDQ